MIKTSTTLGLCAALLLAGTVAANAQSVADFYKGKSVNLLIGVGVGGEYDLHARLTGRFIGRHLPGNPTVVPQNMTGAGGIKMANYLYSVAAKDGTHMGMMSNTLPLLQATDAPGLQLDVAKFNWIGSIAPTVETMTTWHTTNVKTVEDARKQEIIAGASGKGAMTYTFPVAMNELLGTKFKIVVGYEGGNAINLAMERGEVQSRNNTWSSWKVTKADWLRDKKIHVIAYAGPKVAELPGVPTLRELAKSDDDRKVLDLITSGTEFGRPLALTPDVPAARVQAMRAAFDATMKDKDFMAEAAKLNIEIEPVRGDYLQSLAKQLVDLPKPLAMRAKSIVE
ncbi:MAG: Bug family tripartite tricarboxylate transporter substrate binding protein [Alphaproteobacteria bacterium]